MASVPLLLAQLDALDEDLAVFKPFRMVILTEFGIVLGYAPEYGELRADALETLAFCGVYFPELATHLEDAPSIVPNQHVNEDKLADELRALRGRLRRTRTGLAAAPKNAAAARLSRVSADDRRRFARLLARSGVAVSVPDDEIAGPVEAVLTLSSERLTSAARDVLMGAGPEKIFVSNRFGQPLRDQISEVLAHSGYDPIVGRARRGEPALEESSGAVFSLMPELDGGGGALSAPLRPTVSEVAVAPERLRAKALLVGRRSAALRVPEPLSDLPFFAVKREVMDNGELERFAALTAKTKWRPRES